MRTRKRTKMYGEQYFSEKMEVAKHFHTREYDACNVAIEAAIDCFGVDVALAFIECDPTKPLSIWEGPYDLFIRRLQEGYDGLFTAEDRLSPPFPSFEKSVEHLACEIQSFHKVITDSIGESKIETDIGLDLMQEPGRELRMYLLPKPWTVGCDQFLWLYFAFESFVRRVALFRICQAPDCGEVFYASPRGRMQAFCSRRCQNRVYMRSNRKGRRRVKTE